MKTEQKRALVIDDEASIRMNVADILTPLGFHIFEASDGLEGFRVFSNFKPHVVILDINMPGKSGLEVLKEIKRTSTDIPVIIFTAFGTSERAIEAMKLGAYEYIEKPFEIDEFILLVERAWEYHSLLCEVENLRSLVRRSAVNSIDSVIIGRNREMQNIFKLIGRIAPTDATVLIQGESGTGKEMIADAIQRHSERADKPYVKINCGALSESVLESEIFGHEKGSFTGADSRRKGLFEIADGGTVYLDEINSMPRSLQVRLLRILQKQPFFRMGGVVPVSVDVRVIASSNLDIDEEVSKKNFREDLYYRLNVVRITVPPLRRRRDDINHLIDHFIARYGSGEKIIISPETRKILNSYHWPGNIRELENTIYSAIVTSSDKMLHIGELPFQASPCDYQDSVLSMIEKGMSFRDAVTWFENQLIREALAKNDNNQTKTASYLKMNRRQLYSRLRGM